MAFTKSLAILATLSGVVFPLSLIAQEEVTRGNGKMPHVVPGWFVRMASAENSFAPEIDGFTLGPEKRSSYGVPHAGRVKYPCNPQPENGRVTWQFCEM